jgi:glycosyltransferase involved in cell wall biosynthesis
LYEKGLPVSTAATPNSEANASSFLVRSRDRRIGRRLCFLFHEAHMLGAGLSVLRVLGHLNSYGWTSSGWFPDDGPLREEAASMLVEQDSRRRPIAFSAAGWQRPPGVAKRVRETPHYLRAYTRWLQSIHPHLVHANSLLMLPEATIARALGAPVVLQVHELPPPGRKRDATVRWAASVADVLIGVCAPVSDMLRERAVRTPVVTVHNGVPVNDATPRADESKFTVGTVGYVSRTKGTDLFMRAAEITLRSRPEVRFEHIGQARLWGDAEFDGMIDDLAASAALRHAVTFLGPADVSAALARWHVFVLPSRMEGFPLSSLEAMAAGLAVVATNVGGVPEQIVHLETGLLVPPESAEALAESIIRLHDDSALRGRLGEAARETVRRSFTLGRQAKALDSAYELALSRHSARRWLLPKRSRSASR